MKKGWVSKQWPKIAWDVDGQANIYKTKGNEYDWIHSEGWPAVPVVIIEAEKVAEAITILKSIAFPLEWPKLLKVMEILGNK
jgi:hypothetical protein